MAEKKTQEKKAAPEVPDTPSAKALEKVGEKYDSDYDPADQEAANAQGEAYLAEKLKRRHGY